MHTHFRRLAAAAILPALWAGSALAGTTTLTLTRNALTNVSDAAGLNQYEAGTVAEANGKAIGYYNVTRRVTTGFSGPLNTAASTITLVLSSSNSSPLQNITLQGSHNYTSGAFLGSVSAASGAYHFTIGAYATGTAGSTETLSMTWHGSTPFP